MKRLAAIAVLAVFAAALYALHHELAQVHLRDVMASFRAIPVSAFALAVALTVLSYAVLAGYDFLGLRYAGKQLPIAQVAVASFIAYAVGHNVGLAMLSGGSVRLRLYSRAGLSALQVGKVIVVCTVTFGLGVSAVFAVVCAVMPADVTAIVPIPAAAVRGVGVAMLLALIAYTLWNALRRAPIEIRGALIPLPGLAMTVMQFLLAGVDLMVASAVLYVLLPVGSDVPYASFLGLYAVAMVAAIISHVPAGLGVFEVVLVSAMPGIASHDLLASILAYRALYYLLPLAVAAALLAAHELSAYRGQFARLAERTGAVIGGVASPALGVLVFISGVVLVFSGATPSVEHRLPGLGELVPLAVVEVSNLVASVVGLALLLLARGLLLRLNAAWYATAMLLVIGGVLSILKGYEWEEAGILMIALIVLISGRGEFYRKASLTRLRFTPGWLGAIALVVLGSLWLGVFSYKHVGYSSELWWQFALDGEAPRFLRASLVLVLVTLVTAGWLLMRPVRPDPQLSDAAALERARLVVQASSSSQAWLALVGDKRLLFDESGAAFVMYGIRGTSWIAMGDPVGPESLWEDLLWDFRELVDRHGGRPAFYQVDGAKLPYYLDLGLQAMKLGEAARVALPAFSLEGGRRADLRQARRRAQRDGAAFEVLSGAALKAVLPDLERISDTWLVSKNTAEKRFSVGFFNSAYLTRTPCAVIRQQGELVAFANLWPGDGLEELSVDLMRYSASAPKGVMDYLFVELLLWGQAQGYQWFNLGMAPLAGLDRHALAPTWHRLGSFVFQHGEHFYNFEGLRAYKEKFDPVWQPRYLVTRGGFDAARVLIDVGVLIAGGVRKALGKGKGRPTAKIISRSAAGPV